MKKNEKKATKHDENESMKSFCLAMSISLRKTGNITEKCGFLQTSRACNSRFFCILSMHQVHQRCYRQWKKISIQN